MLYRFACRSAVFCLWLMLAFAPAAVRADTWKDYMEAARAAHERGNDAEAEREVLAALEEARNIGPGDPHLPYTLNYLALLYQTQGRFAEAEPLYRRAIATWGNLLTEDHPNVAMSLNNLAALYRTQQRLRTRRRPRRSGRWPFSRARTAPIMPASP